MMLDDVPDPRLIARPDPLDERTGWISPDGRFHQCLPGEHGRLTSRFSQSTDPLKSLDRDGWIKVSGGELYAATHHLRGTLGHRRPTPRQQRTAAKLCAKWGKQVPLWMLPGRR
jgi:hypothetical protein